MKKSILALALAASGTLAVTAISAQEQPQVPGAPDVSRVQAGDYTLDASHTLVSWQVGHFGFNDYIGLFGQIVGTMTLDPADIDATQFDITVPITSVSVPSEGLRDHLLRPGKDGGDPDFFGAEPEAARFVSTSVDLGADGTSAEITGNLALNGVTRPVKMDARFTGAGAHPRSQVETVGFEASGTILRSEFGIGYAIPMVSDEVELKISAAFEKQ